LPKSLGRARLSGKIAWGSPYFGLNAFLLASVLKIAGASYNYHPSSPLTPLCPSMASSNMILAKNLEGRRVAVRESF
jgi:hypothetical protein